MTTQELRVRELESEVARLQGSLTDAIEQTAIRRTACACADDAALRAVREERTREGILDAARAWHELYGESPSDTTWSPAALRKRGRSDEIERFLSACWPSSSTVRRRLGGFPTMLREAG